MNKSDLMMISYAIGTEIDAINMYSFMIDRLPEECKPKLEHIMKEEKEHAIELIQLLKGDYSVNMT